METIGTDYKNAINKNFLYSLIERNEEGIANTFNGGVHHCPNMCIVPKVEEIKLVKIDNFHDKLSLRWADYTIEGIISWKPSDNKTTKAMVFYGIE